MIIAKYNTETGLIEATLRVADEYTADLNVSEGFSWIEWPYDQTDQVDYKVDVSSLPHSLASKTVQSLTPTPSSITADGTSKSVVGGIAIGSQAEWYIDGVKQSDIQIPGTKINFCTDIVDDHSIIIRHPLWLDTTVTITATAP